LAWMILSNHWNESYRTNAVEALTSSRSPGTTEQIWLCLAMNNPSVVAEIEAKLVERGDVPRLLEAIVEMTQAQQATESDAIKEEFGRILALLGSPFNAIASALREALAGQIPKLGKHAVNVLERARAESELCSWIKIRLSEFAPLPVHDDIRWLLAHAGDVGRSEDALSAAIRLHMFDDVTAALRHRFASVAAAAVGAVGARLSAPLPPAVLDLANADEKPVRSALVSVLRHHPHERHFAILLKLAQDTWSSSYSQYGERPKFDVARAAVDAIVELPALPRDGLDALLEVGLNTDDSVVAQGLLQHVIEKGGIAEQETVLEAALSYSRWRVRAESARALLSRHACIDSSVASSISLANLLDSDETVASRLTLLLAIRGTATAQIAIAQRLSVSKRAALLLLMIWVATHVSMSRARRLAAFLPKGHPAVAAILKKSVRELSGYDLTDLGSATLATEVVGYFQNE